MAKSNKNLESLLEKINYVEHKWDVCEDFKILTMILEQQTGFTKFSYFLYLWDSRDRGNHYVKEDWSARTSFNTGTANVIQHPLIDPKKVLILPLHIKLGLMKQFVKVLGKERLSFKYLGMKFPNLLDAKLKEVVFDGPQIRKMFKNDQFSTHINEIERRALNSFKEVCENFLGNYRIKSYEKLIAEMVEKFRVLGCNMSLKRHTINSHIDYFPKIVEHYSKEQGEWFHQDIKEMERRYQVK